MLDERNRSSSTYDPLQNGDPYTNARNSWLFMKDKIHLQIEGYKQERNALIAEANERVQRQQQLANEHSARMTEIQTKVSQLEGAIQALETLLPTVP